MTTPDHLPYGRQDVDDDDVAAVVAVLRSDRLTTGPAVERFEAALSAVAGGHPVVAVSSGTAALHAAYAAAGVGPGRNVVTTPLTFAATATAALHLGAEVRFADVDDATLLLDAGSAAAVVDDATAAVVPVDLAGQPAASADLAALAARHGAVVVEDAAHSIGGRLHDRPVGDLADLTTFSFHPVKTITTGEGGAVVVRDRDLLDAVRRFRSHGMVRERARLRDPDEGPWHQEVQTLGLNYRLPDVLAALGTSQLRRLDAFVARRAALLARYREALADDDRVRFLGVRPGAEPAWHLCAVRVPAALRRGVVERLRADGIGVQVHYLPVHLHPLLREHGWRRGDLPVAEAAYAQLVSLPLFPRMRDDDVERVVVALRAALDRAAVPA